MKRERIWSSPSLPPGTRRSGSEGFIYSLSLRSLGRLSNACSPVAGAGEDISRGGRNHASTGFCCRPQRQSHVYEQGVARIHRIQPGMNRQRLDGRRRFTPMISSRISEQWRASQTTGQPLDCEARLRRGSDGAYRWFLIRAVPVKDKRGKIVKWCGAATDIEDRKRAEQLQADLTHASRVSTMGELVASISHELAQPTHGHDRSCQGIFAMASARPARM